MTEETFAVVERQPVSGTCDECGAQNLMKYPVLALGGWFMAVKCQACLASVSREPWHRLGWVELEEDRFL
jgi:vanillate/4-hydroxybenzoate decarboxylase subunit D